MGNASDSLIGLILKEALLNVNHPDILFLIPLILRSRRNLTKNCRPCSFLDSGILFQQPVQILQSQMK